MSRHITFVSAKVAAEVFQVPLTKKVQRLYESGFSEQVSIAHGYDRPLSTFFCDLASGAEHFKGATLGWTGVCYGSFDLSSIQLNKDQYTEALKKLGLNEEALSVFLDKPY